MSMKTISVVCEKGGTGKSVLANELYAAMTRQGYRTSLYSLDGQYEENSRSHKVEDAEVAIVDTPGVISDNLKEIIEGSDVIVVPVRPTPNDIEPFTRTIEIIKKNTDAPVLIVVNGFNRFRMSASFLTWLEKKPWAEHVCIVPQSEAIVQAEGLQKSVCELPGRGNAALAIERMANDAAKLAGLKYSMPRQKLMPKTKPKK
jgi:chromosome partitioning protein